MRKGPVLTLLAALLLTGCGQTSQSNSTGSAEATRTSQTSPLVSATTETTPSEVALPEPSTTYRIPTIDPKKEERANEDITIICGIVTREVSTHEFPQLWLEGSRESKLAEEYEKLLPGNQAHDALMRDCPAYAELHSKNAG